MWTTLHANNNRLYVTEADQATLTEHSYLIQVGNYTGQPLDNKLLDTLNANKTLPTEYSVSYDDTIGKLTITNPTPDFIVMTRDALIGTSWNGGAPLTRDNVRDCNDVIGNVAGSTTVVAGVLQMGGDSSTSYLTRTSFSVALHSAT